MATTTMDAPPSSVTTTTTTASTLPPNNRFSIPFTYRLPLTTLASSTFGFLLGATHGGSLRALRFRAENAHRLPTSQVGWYLYHKSKNYHVMLGGVREGSLMALRLGFWTGAFFAMEEAVDRLRGVVVREWVGYRGRENEVGVERLKDEYGVWVQRDFLSTVVAALGTAGGFSAWNRFEVHTAARTARLGLKAGLVFGLVQDAAGLARGRRLGYVEWFRRHLFGAREGKVTAPA